MRALFITLLVLAIKISSYGQNINVSSGFILPAIVVNGDTLGIVRVQQVTIFPPLQFNTHDDYLRYQRLVRDVKKVYPYSQIARRTMIEIQLGLDTIHKNRDRRKYVKEKESELMTIYAEELKKLTVRQGRILIKLVDRELDKTTYEIIKELRGGMQAFLWQQVARMFGESLKSEYDAKGEDLLIERIIMMIEEGRL